MNSRPDSIFWQGNSKHPREGHESPQVPPAPAGGTVAVLAACTDLKAPDGTARPSTTVAKPAPWFKDPAPFIEHGDKNLEARLEKMQG